MLEYATGFEELSRYGYATIDTIIKRHEKSISELKPKLAKATLSHIRDTFNVLVEMALRQEEMSAFLNGNKAWGAQGGQNQKRKYFHKKGAQKS